MAVLLRVHDHILTHDHTYEDRAVDPVLEAVDKFKHVQLGESEFAIDTHQKLRTAFNKIVTYLRSNVRLMVPTLTKPFSSSVTGSMAESLHNHLPED